MSATRLVNVVFVVLFLTLGATLSAVGMSDYYRVENLPAPPGVTPACGGLDFLPDGRLVAVFDHGQLCIYDFETSTWTTFADGFHTPLGLVAISEHEFYVVQRAELTRVVDYDGDGTADAYENISDDWGMTGNYHEFAFGTARDSEGNFYVPLGVASARGFPWMETRGPFNPAGYVGEDVHYSCAPYRGWVIKISPDGTFTPYASGFRQGNGITVGPDDRIFVADNQGDWKGTSALYHVEAGEFYGHAASLVWREDYDGPLSPLEQNRLRRRPAIEFPHAVLANSPGQPAFDLTGGDFGPFTGQMFVPEFVTPRILRVMLEEVGGELQGAATTFFDGPPLHLSNIRLSFAPDGSLWTGQTERQRGWPGTVGIQRLVWNGKTPFDVLAMNLTNDGFEFTFTKPVDPQVASDPGHYNGERYYYRYQADYGSPRTDIHSLSPRRVIISPDRRSVRVELDRLVPGYLYQFSLDGLTAENGESIVNPLIVYTLNQLLDGTGVTLPRPTATGKSQGAGSDKPNGAAGRAPD